MKYFIGMDVGSTTVKAVVMSGESDQPIWQDYQRHETKQPEKVLEFLRRIEAETPVRAGNARIFITGSGGSGMGKHFGAKFVQEVNAVSLAVEKLYPKCRSVIELGGQDAKMIFFRVDPETGKIKKLPTMNDKCAGGTGAVIDKINGKLKIPAAELSQQTYNGKRLHKVAGKCGVFAETDINSLQKTGVPRDELMASLFESIIQQNISVLTRGNTLVPQVLLLGGPNTFIQGMIECWRYNLPLIWKERNIAVPDEPLEELIKVPDNAQYFACLGALEFGKDEDETVGLYTGFEALQHYVTQGRNEERSEMSGGHALYKSPEELAAFTEKYRYENFDAPPLLAGSVVKAFVGVDGGSTSTKAVLIAEDGTLIAKKYQLSKGNPIEDTMDMFAALNQHITERGCTLEILGVGTTGYAKDILKDVLKGDVALVETVAHTESALHFYDKVDVICDVGGQDIKVIILKDRKVKDFRINTQCSAGNGYFLQNTSEGFGFKVEEFAEKAFSAKAMPTFGYGCAVFMQSDIVDFQRKGWQGPEIMAGLADVLPKNIWLYVCQIPNLAKLGKTFILQGGTQRNLAAVKSQVDFIRANFDPSMGEPEIIVHKHCGESGAIGAAIEARRLYGQGKRTDFIGVEKVAKISYKTTRDESTRCYFCKNKCLRTFIDVKTEDKPMHAQVPAMQPIKTKVPLEVGSQRMIIATCEKGEVEDVNAMKDIKKGLDQKRKENPNLVEWAALNVFKSWEPATIARDGAPLEKRAKLKIGMPRVLNMYSMSPFFTGYFESLGIPHDNLIFSDYTDEHLYKEGAKRGAIDPCFPSKLGIPHVHNLLYKKHKPEAPLDLIFFPQIDDLPSPLKATQGCRSCPTVCSTPEGSKAAFTKESDLFTEKGVVFKDTFVNLAQPALAARQMLGDWANVLDLTEAENILAVQQGFACLQKFQDEQQRLGRQTLELLENEERLGIVLLGRPYHNDPGINHEILDEFQKLGYPIFTQESLPIQEDYVERLFGEEVRQGEIPHGLAITDVWKNAYSENTNRKVWGAKFVARHPNLVALELSNFKCGHDAPIYTVIEEIIEKSGTPFFCFKDIDENKPSGSIKIRVETISYFLKRYQESKKEEIRARREIEARIRALEAELRSAKSGGLGNLLKAAAP